MKTKMFLLAACFFAASINLCAQTTVHETQTLYPISYPVGQFKHNIWDTKNKKKISSSTDYGTSSYGLGRLFPSSTISLTDTTVDSTALVSRSCFTFSWSQSVIPTNASNIKVTVNYSAGGYGYTFKLTQISTITTIESQTLWNAAGNGTKTDGAISYGTSSFVSSAIANAVKNNLSTGKLYLGALSENETADNSNSTLTLYLAVEYDRPAQTVTYWAQNDLDGGSGGQIGVGVNASPTSYSSPHSFTATEGSTVNLTAYDNQSVSGNTWCFNDNEAPANRSHWYLNLGGRHEPKSDGQSMSFTPDVNDNNAAYTAYLHKYCSITRNDQTEFDGTQSAGVVASTVEGNSVSFSAPSTKSLNGRNYSFGGWADEGGGFPGQHSGNPRSATLWQNTAYPAMYKIPHKSNQSNAFFGNGQSKLVLTVIGSHAPYSFFLHTVYESMGHVWYEYSTDYGSTWRIGNDGYPLDFHGGKSPSIDTYGNQVIVTFAEPHGNSYGIEVLNLYYSSSSGKYVLGTGYLYGSGGDTTPYGNANPEPCIAWGFNYNYMVIWKVAAGSYPGINYAVGNINGMYMNASGPQGIIQGTESPHNPLNPTIYSNKSLQTPVTFNVAWVEYVSSHSSSVKYKTMTYDYQYVTDPSSVQTASSGGIPVNLRPTIVGMPDGSARLCWIADHSAGSGDPYSVHVCYVNLDYPSIFTEFGMNAQSVSMNLKNNSTPYFVWSQYWNGSWTNYVSNCSGYTGINTSGKDLQLSNGVTVYGPNFMYASAFSPFSQPYYFQTSSYIGSFLSKGSPTLATYGRGIAISSEGGNFFYSFGNLIVDGRSIDFVHVPDTLRCDTLQNVNSALLTKPFELHGTSEVFFTQASGVADSSLAAKALGENGSITCKIELVDAVTEKVIGTVVTPEGDFRNISLYNRSDCMLTSDGIDMKSARVRITVSTNLKQPRTSLVKIFADQSVIDKAKTKGVNLKKAEVLKDYSLFQNYPNPFNPTTVIGYTIPKDGMVSLKIFDVLGREVRSLVHENQAVGRYSVTFDAAGLASGIYFYQLRSGDYMSIKKMLFVK